MNNLVAISCAAWMSAAAPPPSNIAPLAFGMTVQDATNALGVPLIYVSGRPGSEVFVAQRRAGPHLLYPTRERVYLQFRRGCLTGFKKDWKIDRRGPF